MLSFIADLDTERVHGRGRARHTISAPRLYREILRLLAGRTRRERATGGPGGGAPASGPQTLWLAVTTLAVRLWEAASPGCGWPS